MPTNSIALPYGLQGTYTIRPPAVAIAMDVPSNSLNVRFWSRRETILRPVLWSPEDLRRFGCHFGDIHTSQLQDHVVPPVEDSSAATGPDVIQERRVLNRLLHDVKAIGVNYVQDSTITTFL